MMLINKVTLIIIDILVFWAVVNSLFDNFSLESEKYNQEHTKTQNNARKKTLAETLSRLKSENAVSDRALRQAKLAQSKKDEADRKLKEERDKLHDEVDKLNDGILADSWMKDKEIRRRDDPHLTKKAQKETMEARQESSLVEIDISI